MGYEMYQEQILDHYKNPRNFGTLEEAEHQAHDNNPLCGDDIAFYLKVKDGVVEDVRFEGQGCAISQASASLLTLKVKGKTLEAIKAFDKDTILEMLGIPVSPVRMKCALLSLQVVKQAVWGRELAQELETAASL
jgi:nitrogen fixation NifU-like protein